MKKIIFAIIIFAFWINTALGISYNGGPTPIYPTFSTVNGNYTASNTFDYGVNQNSNNTVRSNVFSQTIEVDFTNLNHNSGAILLYWGMVTNDFGGINYFFDLYLSGNTLGYSVWNTSDNGVTKYIIKKGIISGISGLVTPYSNINFGGYFPKRASFIIGYSSISFNPIFGNDSTYLQSIGITAITDEAKGIILDYTSSGSTNGVLVGSLYGNNIATAEFTIPTLYGLTIYNLYTNGNIPDILPYVNNVDGSYNIDYNSVQGSNNRKVGFGDQTANILDVWGGSTIPLDNIYSNFYIGSGVTITSTGGLGGGGGGSGTGSITEGWYDECGGFTDLFCYVSSTIDGIFDYLTPDISFDSSFDTCDSSVITSSGGIFDRFTGAFRLLNPIAPGSGSTICYIQGSPFIGSGVITYNRLIPEENFFEHYVPGEFPMLEISPYVYGDLTIFDFFIIIVFSIIIFYPRGKH